MADDRQLKARFVGDIDLRVIYRSCLPVLQQRRGIENTDPNLHPAAVFNRDYGDYYVWTEWQDVRVECGGDGEHLFAAFSRPDGSAFGKCQKCGAPA